MIALRHCAGGVLASLVVGEMALLVSLVTREMDPRAEDAALIASSILSILVCYRRSWRLNGEIVWAEAPI